MDILEKMQKEWELTLLLFVFLVLLIAGGIFAAANQPCGCC